MPTMATRPSDQLTTYVNPLSHLSSFSRAHRPQANRSHRFIQLFRGHIKPSKHALITSH